MISTQQDDARASVVPALSPVDIGQAEKDVLTLGTTDDNPDLSGNGLQ